MKVQILSTIVIVAASLIGLGRVSAMPAAASKSAISSTMPFLVDGEAELAPLAHVKFCVTHAGQCPADLGKAGKALEADAIAVLERVNREVNRRIRPRAKFSTIGQWAINPTSGDCNDYAVTKRHLLVSLGLPQSALRLAVVRTRWGEGHLVLVARTSEGDHVLDNLSDRVLRWDATGHSFLKIQSASDARNWSGVATADSVDVPLQLAASSKTVGEEDEWYIGQP